ncbi:uncharacterized protein LOC124313430 [Daphnia pulicaria]|uniref:uncharacterized protein LOC124313430 n=1 Tax=Daphnia pulicaria TaxID=35523 RepID=UPI001EEAC2B3|nr:uncharacterized protein LOC124313430 [Daphnia pulicaria]
MSQIFFCTIYDGNATFVYKCKAETELCCGRGCCPMISSANSIWSQWYFWFGIAIFAILVVGIFLTLTSNSCRPQPIYTENVGHQATASRYGIRHILGVQQSRVTNVAPTGVVCGPTGLIQPAAIQSKFSLLNSANNRESVGLAPLRPPYPLQLNAGRFDHSMVTDDIV